MEPKYSALEIANYFLLRAEKEDQELLSNLKLQKLVYYAQGIHLAMHGEPLFGDQIEAWIMAPLFRTCIISTRSMELVEFLPIPTLSLPR